LAREWSVAGAAWREYEAAVDFHGLTPAEVELLGLVARRLEKLAPESPMRARIGGIERKNWSRTQLAVVEAGAGLRALEAGGVEMLLGGGAGRVAAGGASTRGCLVTDVDVVVRPPDLERAFEILTGDGWRPAGSGAAASQRARVSLAVGPKLVRGQFGSLRLHRTPFYPSCPPAADDASVWERSAAGTMSQAAVRLPSVTDALAITLAQDSQSSYWMVDIAAAVDRGVDWELLEVLAARRRLHAPGLAGLRYVRERLQRSVPDSALRRLEHAAVRHPAALAAWLTRTHAGSTGLLGLAGSVFRQGRVLHWRWRSALSSLGRRGARMESGVEAE
jgi:hypothetical protein